VITVLYTINRTGNTGQEGKTPYELWFNKTPDINHLEIFGSEVYAHIPKEKRRKWDQKGRKGIFVGYSEATKGYRICFNGRKRSLYGLKQAPGCWNKKFKYMLMNFDLKEAKAYPCVFVSNKNNQLLIVAIFVDDGLIAATNNQLVDIMVKYPKDDFETKEGVLDHFLGIEIDQRPDGSIFIHQSSYCKRILESLEKSSWKFVVSKPNNKS